MRTLTCNVPPTGGGTAVIVVRIFILRSCVSVDFFRIFCFFSVPSRSLIPGYSSRELKLLIPVQRWIGHGERSEHGHSRRLVQWIGHGLDVHGHADHVGFVQLPLSVKTRTRLRQYRIKICIAPHSRKGCASDVFGR